jgi:hypothetical protein
VKVARYRRYSLVILTRNEHCPPHVHVGDSDWEARFKFSYWHDTVCLWDVVPAKNGPTAALLEQIRQVLTRPANLRRARQLWWKASRTLCLDNLMWEPDSMEVVGPKRATRSTSKIVSAAFDAVEYRVVLVLDAAPDLEIRL